MKSSAFFTILLVALAIGAGAESRAAIPGGSLDPNDIPKYQTALTILPAMPPSTNKVAKVDYFEVAARQIQQQVLPAPLPLTTVWAYGTPTVTNSFHWPSPTIEARVNRPLEVKWINQLVDANNHFLPHLFTVDQTLHWANPPGPRDAPGSDGTPYTGPIPLVTHLHGGHSDQESDGFPEAWYLPAANDIPAGYATTGTYYDLNKDTAATGSSREPGSTVFHYRNDQRATTLWFHDHALGLTRVNVYAGLVGLYLLRGGDTDLRAGNVPGPAPSPSDKPGQKYYEIPLIIQDRSFNADGSLFYPSNRAFFEGLAPDQLRIPITPEPGCDGNPSDVAPFWNPEFFGNCMVVNGSTWPVLNVEARRYRFRVLNASNSRFMILKLVTGDPTVRPGVTVLPFWQIGSDGGLLPAPVQRDDLLIAKAERDDVIVDFSGLAPGTEVFLINEGPDEPFGGGVPGTDFDYADPLTTGQVMKFVVDASTSKDKSLSPARLKLPKFTPVAQSQVTRRVSINELDSANVFVDVLGDGTIVSNCASTTAFGPIVSMLGTVSFDETNAPSGNPLFWADAITENPLLNGTETWEIYNFTEDAHPIHIHVVQFQVVDRQPFDGSARSPEAWERGTKDTVIAYPGEITRVRATFDIPGLFTWHCHILEHEDKEMMRPYRIGP